MLVIRYLDLRYDEINRIVSKRHRVYISSYRISVSPLSLSFSPSFFPSFFDSQRLKPQSMHEDYVIRNETLQHFLITVFVEFIMQSNDAICLKNEKVLHT